MCTEAPAEVSLDETTGAGLAVGYAMFPCSEWREHAQFSVPATGCQSFRPVGAVWRLARISPCHEHSAQHGRGLAIAALRIPDIAYIFEHACSRSDRFTSQ